MIDILSAYWKVAVKRIIDGVVMVLIDAYTSRTHFTGLEKWLLCVIALTSDGQELRNLFVETPQKDARREELIETEARMRNAQEPLQKGVR